MAACPIPRKKPKFRGSARNSAACGKLWALVISLISDPVNDVLSRHCAYFITEYLSDVYIID